MSTPTEQAALKPCPNCRYDGINYTGASGTSFSGAALWSPPSCDRCGMTGPEYDHEGKQLSRLEQFAAWNALPRLPDAPSAPVGGGEVEGITPLPWAWLRVVGMYHVLGSTVGLAPGDIPTAKNQVLDDGSAGGEHDPAIDVNGPDARFIVHAVNTYHAREGENERLRGALSACVQVMKEWGNEEDGIPDFAWPAYEDARAALTQPTIESEIEKKGGAG